MAYFDTTMHGWRYADAITSNLPSFIGEAFTPTNIVFDGTNLYLTYAEPSTSSPKDAVGETYKYSFNPTTKTFTYVTKVSVGGHAIVDDGTYIWILNFVKVYRYSKSTMTGSEITLRSWVGSAIQLQKSMFVAEGYLWAIEHCDVATTNQQLYRINMSTLVVSTFTPAWGIVRDRFLCGGGGKVWSNPTSYVSQSIKFPTIAPSTGALTTTTITHGVGVPTPTSNSVIALFSGTTTSFYVVDGVSRSQPSTNSWTSTAVSCYMVNTTDGTATSVGTFLCSDTIIGGTGTPGPAVHISESTDGESFVKMATFDAVNTTLFYVSSNNAYINVRFPVIAAFNPQATYAGTFVYGGGCLTQYYGSTKIDLGEYVVPIGGTTYSSWQVAPAQQVTLNKFVGGIGSSETNVTLPSHGTSTTLCKYGQTLILFGGTGAGNLCTVFTLPNNPKQIAIRPHILSVGCNIGLS